MKEVVLFDRYKFVGAVMLDDHLKESDGLISLFEATIDDNVLYCVYLKDMEYASVIPHKLYLDFINRPSLTREVLTSES
jgi:hypothetical protein